MKISVEDTVGISRALDDTQEGCTINTLCVFELFAAIYKAETRLLSAGISISRWDGVTVEMNSHYCNTGRDEEPCTEADFQFCDDKDGYGGGTWYLTYVGRSTEWVPARREPTVKLVCDEISAESFLRNALLEHDILLGIDFVKKKEKGALRSYKSWGEKQRKKEKV